MTSSTWGFCQMLNRSLMKSLSLVILLLVGVSTAVAADFEYTDETIEGWTIRMAPSMLDDTNAAVLAKTRAMLGHALFDIKQQLSAERIKDLQTIVIVVEADNERLSAMQYHPSKEWLRENGHDVRVARCVHIPVAKQYVNPRHHRTQPWCVMHELAHAYHDQFLSFEHPEVIAAFEKSRDAKLYDDVRFINGGTRKHYALTNHKEFFAELTESYVGTNDFYPFVRGELADVDPTAFAMLEKIWGKLE